MSKFRPCPDCGWRISKKASLCQHCGRPLHPVRMKKAKTVAWTFVGLVACVTIGFKVFSSPHPTHQQVAIEHRGSTVPDPVEVGKKAYMMISERNYESCKSIADLKQYYEVKRTDAIAAEAFSTEHGCTQIEPGTKVVAAESSPNGYLCVRTQAGQQCGWVEQSKVESVSAYADDTAHWDRQGSDSVSVMRVIKSAFEREHPECKDYMTNPHLPEYCY